MNWLNDVASRVHALVGGGQMNQDAFAGLIAAALTDAQIAAIGLRETVIPAWPPWRRTFPDHLARRLEDGLIFDDSFIDDLNTFLGMLKMKIATGTHIGWDTETTPALILSATECAQPGRAAKVRSGPRSRTALRSTHPRTQTRGVMCETAKRTQEPAHRRMPRDISS